MLRLKAEGLAEGGRRRGFMDRRVAPRCSLVLPAAEAAIKGDRSSTKDAVSAQLGTEVVPRVCRELPGAAWGRL